MRYQPTKIAAIDPEGTVVDRENPTECDVVLVFDREPDDEWRKLFEAAFKTAHTWPDSSRVRFRGYRANAAALIGEAIVAAEKVNSTLDAPQPVREAQEQLDVALRRFAGQKGLSWGDDGRPARTFNYRM